MSFKHFDVLLCFGVALLGRLVEPSRCLGVVLLHTLAVYVPDAEVVLRFGMPLFGRFAVPLQCLGRPSSRLGLVRTWSRC